VERNALVGGNGRDVDDLSTAVVHLDAHERASPPGSARIAVRRTFRCLIHWSNSCRR
jgi:hypothetical protein